MKVDLLSATFQAVGGAVVDRIVPSSARLQLDRPNFASLLRGKRKAARRIRLTSTFGLIHVPRKTALKSEHEAVVQHWTHQSAAVPERTPARTHGRTELGAAVEDAAGGAVTHAPVHFDYLNTAQSGTGAAGPTRSFAWMSAIVAQRRPAGSPIQHSEDTCMA